jgi:hypothetical protein
MYAAELRNTPAFRRYLTAEAAERAAGRRGVYSRADSRDRRRAAAAAEEDSGSWWSTLTSYFTSAPPREVPSSGDQLDASLLTRENEPSPARLGAGTPAGRLPVLREGVNEVVFGRGLSALRNRPTGGGEMELGDMSRSRRPARPSTYSGYEEMEDESAEEERGASTDPVGATQLPRRAPRLGVGVAGASANLLDRRDPPGVFPDL